MRKRNLTFLAVEDVRRDIEHGFVVFQRPLGGKLFRAYVPDQVRANTNAMHILSIWSYLGKNGVFYFRNVTSEYLIDTVVTSLDHLGIECVIREPSPEVWGTDVNEPRNSTFFGVMQSNPKLN